MSYRTVGKQQYCLAVTEIERFLCFTINTEIHNIIVCVLI